jgi:2-iminobutanoate/2-iminopropanoate deaminase
VPRERRKLPRMNSRLLRAARFAACFFGCCLASSWAQPPKAPVYYPMPSTGGAPLPFSEAVQLGDTLYVSGQVGNLPGTLTLAPGGLGPEARQALENMKAVLERHGSSLDNVVKCTVFLADIKEWPAFNEIYRTFFTKNLPARSALAASGLAIGARVEIECIAFVPPKGK